MVIKENNCVGCDRCYGCGRKHQEVVKCDGDKCDNYAQYTTDEGDYCKECLNQLLDDVFKDLSLGEKINVLKEYIIVKEI